MARFRRRRRSRRSFGKRSFRRTRKMNKRINSYRVSRGGIRV